MVNGGVIYSRHLQVSLSADPLAFFFQEVNLLEHAASMPAEERQMQQVKPPPADVMQQLLGAAASLQTQQTQRQNLQAQVFRPTVALPTISVEQQVAASSTLVHLRFALRVPESEPQDCFSAMLAYMTIAVSERTFCRSKSPQNGFPTFSCSLPSAEAGGNCTRHYCRVACYALGCSVAAAKLSRCCNAAERYVSASHCIHVSSFDPKSSRCFKL